MYNRLKLYSPVIRALMALAVALVVIAFFFDRTQFYLTVAVTLVTFAAVLLMLRSTASRTRLMLREIGVGIESAGKGSFIDFPMPVIAVYEGSEIIWHNDAATRVVFSGGDMRGEDISEVFPELDVAQKSPPEGADVAFGEKRFTAYVAQASRSGGHVAVIYLIDDAALKFYADEYHQTKPTLALIVIDNYEEMVQDLKEAELIQLASGIHEEIERYIKENHGFVIRIHRDRYLAIIEERGMRDIIRNKFDILDNVRGRYTGDRISATLSIGVSGLDRGAKSLAEAEAMARQALDMCLGRGGDQAAIRTQNGYEFYGGVSKGIEKRTKVKTRIIANALADLIAASSNVIIMGHRFADLDCLGAEIGLYRSVRDMKKHCAICIDREKNLVRELLDKMLAQGFPESDLIQPEAALQKAGDKTMLIVVDTHVPKVLESEALYRACKNVVVIDHHRKLVSHIDNAAIFYHEPYASSASEMVAELIQYLPTHPQINRADAEIMLAGIMLDTKNFALRTGVRTFEAAAYLRRLGADTVEVRKLFSSTMHSFQEKANLVSNAEIYKDCAIAASDFNFDNIKLVAPQAADELMNISGVEASFVIFSTEGLINCSARSMGGINVQLVMEKLGGGGHHTMAAAQFPGESVENVRKMVMEAIDDYHIEIRN